MTSAPISSPAPLHADLLAQWMLREDVIFLNHGSFGAVPRTVLAEQDRWRHRLEAEPIELLGRRQPELIAAAKEPLGQFLHMRPQDFGLVTNATEGINAVLQSLRFSPGDELLTTNHVYNAVRQSMRHIATRQGASYREIPVATPVENGQRIARTIIDGLSDRTRLLVIDHITSPTALVFPVEPIAAACAARGVELLIDGAHAPGMLDLNVPATGATYYAGNLHKWACAPKGCAFLWVAPHRQADIHPCVISHNYGQGLAAEFVWQGTRDASAWLTLPAALQFMADLGWERIRYHNHALTVWAHAMLCERFAVSPLSPIDGQLLGATATVRLPDPLTHLTDDQAKALQQSLYTDHRIEVPLFGWQGAQHLRVSCQVYNRPADYHRLADVITAVARDL
ncbi:MAG: cefD [Phycisphaerales bacterium]|nr:cefD [Phycisphaerales bacterium]